MKRLQYIARILWGRQRTKAEFDESIAGVENYLDVHRWDLINAATISGLLTLAFVSVGLGTQAMIWVAAVMVAETLFTLLRWHMAKTRTNTRNVYSRMSMLQGASFITLCIWVPGLLFGFGTSDPVATTLVLLSWAGALIVVSHQNDTIPRIAITSSAVPAAMIAITPLVYAEYPADVALAGLCSMLVLLVMRNTIANLRVNRQLFEVQADKDELIGELQFARQAAEADRRRADQANRAKSEFLAMMSHEIRTPMNGMLGMAQMLVRGDLPEEQHGYAQTVVDSGEALLALLNDTLDLSRIESGRMSLDADEEDPRRIFEGIEALWGPRARDEGLKFSVEISPDVPARAHIDARKVQQLLSNLVGNAVKFTGQGAISMRASVPKRGHLRFEVVDTGPGIAEEAQKRIFEKFTQADASTTRRYGGSGLGLTLCKEFVELMGGSISVESAEGEGARFIVDIPCRFYESAVAEEPVKRSPDAEMMLGEADDALRILVADDHPINQKLMRAYVDRFGYTCEVVENGRQAVDAVAYGTFDIVLMDVQMPQMDGIAAAAEIRKLPGERAQIPIVAITANAMVGQREEYLLQGFDGYVSKPIDTQALKAEIDRVRLGAGQNKTAASA